MGIRVNAYVLTSGLFYFQSERALSDSMTLNGLSLISPELRKGQPPSPASDMYAFGCLLYWVCKSLLTDIAVSYKASHSCFDSFVFA